MKNQPQSKLIENFMKEAQKLMNSITCKINMIKTTDHSTSKKWVFTNIKLLMKELKKSEH